VFVNNVMKNLNDIANVDNNNSSQTVLSIKSSHVTTRHVMKKGEIEIGLERID